MMRLLNTSLLSFEEFFDDKTPRYAILSHRWDKKEVSFQEYEAANTKKRESFTKIFEFCSLAKSHGFEWAWVDTCCIDKKSSAELSEAINSMFRWYKKAATCYVYLNDVQKRGEAVEDIWDEFVLSKWFTRGWTLQELLAPRNLHFYDKQWDYLGDMWKLMEPIVRATGILQLYLTHPDDASVAMKMSWVSRRRTSRVEDMAYCLLGIFGVNMPLLYGEGEKSFMRLQLEIIRKSDDESIFAWSFGNPKDDHQITGLLALSPRAFASCGSIGGRHYGRPIQPYLMTNKGLEFKVQMPKHPENFNLSNDQTLIIGLSCSEQKIPIAQPSIVVIKLRKLGYYWGRVEASQRLPFESFSGDLFCDGNRRWYDKSLLSWESIYIKQQGL
jgi:hypothetical protein